MPEGPELPPDFPDANDDLADTPVDLPAGPNPVLQNADAASKRPKPQVVAQIRGPVKAKPGPTNELERVPPHNFQVEAEVLSLALADPSAFEKMREQVIPGDFYSGTYATIYDAMLSVPGGIVDSVTVANQLKMSGRLAQVGGTPGIAELCTGVGVSRSMQSYIQIIKELSGQRKLLVTAQLTIAELYAQTGADVHKIADQLGQEIDRFEESAAPIVEFTSDDMFEPEPPANLIVPKLGIGPGPVSSIFGYGFSGKSVASFAMGLAIAAGRDVWGAFTCKPGIWAHFDYEQGRRRCRQLFQRLCKGMAVWRDELAGRVKFAIYPKINLTTVGAETLFSRVFEGVTFATMDALKGMTPGVDENDSSIREHIDMLSRVSERTGCTILLIHHAGKTKDHERPGKEMGRGSSAIYDACGSNFVMKAEKGHPTRVSHEKDRELGLLLDDFGLAIEDVPTDDGNSRGGLRVRHLDMQEYLQKEQRQQDVAAQFEKLKIRIVDLVKANQGILLNALCERIGGREGRVIAAVEELCSQGEIVERGRQSGDRTSGKEPRHLYTKGMAPPARVISVEFKKKPPPEEDPDL
jgi:hypothetical protein